MKIAIIGAGNVGGTLGLTWARKSHDITFGVRDPGEAKVQKLIAAAGGRATAATVPEAVALAPVVVLATPWEGAQNAVSAAGNLAGKILVDATNPVVIGSDLSERGLVIGHTTSAAEQIQQWAPGARVVKAFNTIGAKNMADPRFGGQSATMFICGDDAQAKVTVKRLSDDLGFETVDAGPLTIARLLEPVAMLWIHLCIGMGWGPDFCFKVLHRQSGK